MVYSEKLNVNRAEDSTGEKTLTLVLLWHEHNKMYKNISIGTSLQKSIQVEPEIHLLSGLVQLDYTFPRAKNTLMTELKLIV